MTLRPLDFDFALRSELSTRGPSHVALDEYLLEIDRELEHRARAYPRFVAKGSMTEPEAARHVAVLCAIRDDYLRLPFPAGGDPRWPHRDSDVRHTWDDKVRELRRELALRRAIYPKRIAGNILSRPDAALRMERLEAVHADYWRGLFMFDQWDGCATAADRRDKIRAWSWRIDEANSGATPEPTYRPAAERFGLIEKKEAA